MGTVISDYVPNIPANIYAGIILFHSIRRLIRTYAWQQVQLL
ncbi:MAG: hypothetical protein KatS3mg023_3729 [Armatimonadota bacterium]|nr:MAG: hypothetical protein KatS3mg023_3729 [Armatimonadota bacterium]